MQSSKLLLELVDPLSESTRLLLGGTASIAIFIAFDLQVVNLKGLGPPLFEGNEHILPFSNGIDVRRVVLHRTHGEVHQVVGALLAAYTVMYDAVAHGIVTPPEVRFSAVIAVMASPGARRPLAVGGGSPRGHRPMSMPIRLHTVVSSVLRHVDVFGTWCGFRGESSSKLSLVYSDPRGAESAYPIWVALDRRGTKIPLSPLTGDAPCRRFGIRALARLLACCRGFPRQLLPIVIIDT